ncbi:hypothetical protein LCI18_004677 [Fusarium solani-melongenae]|uniref:Uncharacterized protein n=1 Tax=Fusarium solani subsp. cucurbitae TaxID=2747967 RepID=A0ACD3YY01_FUSSC|nr:hypothetical protein LCI18_004677 [Fusarium solani-melongenae]
MSLNASDSGQQLVGWKATSDDRGSFDLLWSCLVTLLLCCWVTTYANARPPHDKWYHPLLDKFNLAIITFLGPDFLFGIALGQYASARQSVKAFKRDKHITRGFEWKFTHAFFFDMGCVHLTAPDYSIADGKTFPINAEQLHYLVRHNHVEFPDLDQLEIEDRNSLAWIHKGYPITTLELTTLSFCFITFMISILWRFGIDAHWNYYVSLAHKLRINFVSRPITRRPWDRVPSDMWICPGPWYAPGAGIVLVGFSIIFVLAWNVTFPTENEKFLWRICSAYHAAFSLYGGAYYAIEMVRLNRKKDKKPARAGRQLSNMRREQSDLLDTESQRTPSQRTTLARGRVGLFLERARSWRNLSGNQDPNMDVPLRLIIPITITCFAYVLCRFYVYLEDLISLRMQPADVYLTGTKFIPFLPGGV